MGHDIDFSKGGYGGDAIEEMFKSYTSDHMEYWWHFREVLISAQDKYTPHWWKRIDGQPLTDDEYRELIAMSLTHYAVNTGLAEALSFHKQLKDIDVPAGDLFTTRRNWKSLYSSLYSSFNALCNIVCVVVFLESPFGNRPGVIWNWSPSNAYGKANSRGIKTISEPIARCQNRLEIRDHLDHYWTIWQTFSQGTFSIDRNFSKGYVSVNPAQEVQCDVDAVQLSEEHLLHCTEDFDAIYKALATTGGYLDQYLSAKGWYIDYQGNTPPRNRPLP